MRPGLLCSVSLVVFLAIALAACGGDEETGQQANTTEDSAAAAAEALEDMAVKPQIPRPAGTPPRRLEREEIVRGKGRVARAGDDVVVEYVGVSFSTGEQFDASWDAGAPVRFALGGGRVIEGWDEGIAGMREGGRRKLTIPPELAYGREGFPEAGIGPNETLVFVVDLLRVRRN